MQTRSAETNARTGSMSAILDGRAPLIPVLLVNEIDHAEPLLAALEDAGVAAIEVTLRTSVALEAIARMARAAKSAMIGAGTLTRPEHFRQVRDAGAKFAVSPALTPELADAAHASDLPYLPGVATPSEALRARELGFKELKFFPADLMGGPAWLRHVSQLFPDLRFCPTGGVSDENVRSYLETGNVFAVGGVYLAPRHLIESRQWSVLSRQVARSVMAAAAA
jgi:2-dehydro-3-deoxyphosphogluconate aldolase / (4S)-4-hydroxy-2-oxoglutarate aldolase